MQVLSILMTRLSLTSSVLLCYMYDGNSTAAIDGWLESRFVVGSPAAVAAAAASESLDAWSAYAMNQSNIYLDWFDGDFHSGVSVDIPRYQFAPSQHHDLPYFFVFDSLSTSSHCFCRRFQTLWIFQLASFLLTAMFVKASVHMIIAATISKVCK